MLDTIVEGDCIETMRMMQKESVDLVFADPPYNLQLGSGLTRPDESQVAGVVEDWDKFDSFETYDRFTKEWLSAARDLLKPDGAIWVIGSYHNIFRVGAILQDLGFWIQNDVVWVKTNPMPNFRGRRLQNAHETLIWAGKSKQSKVRFNYTSLKAGNDDKQLRSDWVFPLCTGAERLKDDAGAKVHPTQKPEALLKRVIAATTIEGDVVLDPFSGTGTTCAVAKKMGRRFVGIERDPAYLEASRCRIASAVRIDSTALGPVPEKRDLPKVPFRDVVDSGLLDAGDVLVDAAERFSAVVRPDGSLLVGEAVLSIHKGAAILLGRENHNGWDFWHLKSEGGLVPIESFRKQIREINFAAVETAA
jgi:modification methylase